MRCDLSIVATSRNDDHGGNLLHRMQLFVNGLLEQCRRHQLTAELILVEWNPPADRPRLSEALSWPVQNGLCDVRIIEVSPEIHKRFGGWDRLPLFQMIAKNAGIRRARGRFVLATNIDILFSDEIMRFLASGRIKDNRMYRVDRYDVPPNVPEGSPIDQQLEFCRNNVIRIQQRREGYDYSLVDSYDETRKDFLRERWPEFRLKLEKLQDGLFPNSLNRFMFQLPVNLHTNGSGDFTMLSSEVWRALRGYPEFVGYCMHVDALLCFMAHHSGTREKVLTDPMRIYHIEHGTGSGDGAGAASAGDASNSHLPSDVTAGGNGLGLQPKSQSIPCLDLKQFTAWTIEMRREGRPILFNSSDWGLADDNLPETEMHSGWSSESLAET